MRHLLFIFVGCIIIACSQQPQAVLEKTNKTIELKRASGLAEYRSVQYIPTDSFDLLAGLPPNSGTLFIHNMSNGNIIKKVNLFRSALQAFYVQNLDSIFCIPKYDFSLFLKQGTQKTKAYFNPTIDVIGYGARFLGWGNFFEFLILPMTPIIKQEDAFYIPRTVDMEHNLKWATPLAKLKVEQDTFSLKPCLAYYPPKYWKEDSTYHPYSLCISYAINDKKQIVSSIMFSDQLYVYNDDSLLFSKPCRSKYVTEPLEAIPMKDIRNKALIGKREKKAFYLGIIYDTYRQVYYRIVKHKDHGKTYKDYHFSIMILDKDFNLLGEQVFKGTQYQVYSCKVIKEGLMLKRTDDLSGTTRYDVYQLKKVK